MKGVGSLNWLLTGYQKPVSFKGMVICNYMDRISISSVNIISQELDNINLTFQKNRKLSPIIFPVQESQAKTDTFHQRSTSLQRNANRSIGLTTNRGTLLSANHRKIKDLRMK